MIATLAEKSAVTSLTRLAFMGSGFAFGGPE